MESFEDSSSESQRESKDDEKLLFCNFPSEKPLKKKEALGQTLFLLKDDFNISLSQDELKLSTETGSYPRDELKIESQAVTYNIRTNENGLSNDHIQIGIENCKKARRSRLSMVDSTDDSTQEEFESMILPQKLKSLSNKPPLNNVSDRLPTPLVAESKLSFNSDVTSQSASSNQPSIPSARTMVPTVISESDTPIREDSKTPTKFYLYEYPNIGRDSDSAVFSFSTNSHKTWERRSNTDSSPKGRASSRSTRSLPLMKDVQYPKSGGLRTSFSSPIERITKKLPSSTRERNNNSKPKRNSAPQRKLLKKRQPKKLCRSQKPYEFLTTGTPLLKFCRRKPPHWRHFEVDTDLEYLIWYADKKSIKQTRIALIDVEDVLLGQVTPGFQKCPRSQLFHQSFSIKYKRKKYLDLICLTHRDCQMWYYSLRHVLKNIRDGNKWRRMRDIQIPQKHEKSKNAIYPARDGKTWTKYIEYLERSQYQIQRLLKQSEEILKFSGVLSMRKRLKKQLQQLDAWAEESESSEYLLMTQYDELRAIRVEIRVLQYKVAALLREKSSNGSRFSNIFQFGSSKTPTDSCSNCSVPLSMGPSSSTCSGPILKTPSFQRRGSHPGQMQVSPTMAKRGERRRSERAALVPPKWYKRMPREKKSLVRQIMVNDIINETLTAETVTSVCSTFRVSRDEVEAIARYLDEKYKINKITNSMMVSRSAFDLQYSAEKL